MALIMDDQQYEASSFYKGTIAEFPLLTREEENGLAKRVADGDERAADVLVLHNIRLALKIAQKYRGLGMDFDDVASEGIMGLHIAARRFKSAKGCRFSTYAAIWIKQRIRRALCDQSRTIRTPVHFIALIGGMKRVSAKLEDELCREPTDEELAEEMLVPVDRVVKLRLYSMQPTSLDALVGGDTGDTTVLDRVHDPDKENPHETFQKKAMATDIKECMSRLDERSRDIVACRFGLHGNEKMDLVQLGRKWKISRERVRQIQRKAMRRIRSLLERQERSP